MVRRPCCAVLALIAWLVCPTAEAGPPEFTWLNQFAGLPETRVGAVAPIPNGFVAGVSGTLPVAWRAPDGSLECHALIRYQNGQWTTTGDIGVAESNPDVCPFFGGAMPIKAVAPFRNSFCIGGDFNAIGPNALRHFACYSEGGGWQQINGPGNGPNLPVETLASDSNFIYVGGSFTQVDGAEAMPTSANRIVRTSGLAWEPLFSDNAETSNGVNGTVTAILPTATAVYAAVGRSVRRWNPGANDKWMDLGSAAPGSTPIRDIELNSTLVAASASLATTWGGQPAGAVSEYSPGSMEWSAVGSSSGINTRTGALAVAGGFFHATGNFTSIDPSARGIARYNSSFEWEAVPGDEDLGSFVDFRDLFPLGGDICATQQGFDNTQSFFSRGLSCNDGSRWRGLAQGTNGDVRDILRYNGAIIAAGEFTAAGSALTNFIAAYRNGAWERLGDGLAFSGFGGDVKVMAVFRGDLYAMGLFNEADGESAPGLARWDGTSWHAVGEGVQFPGEEMVVWNDRLVFTGNTPSGKGPTLIWDGNTIEELPDLLRTPDALAVYDGALIAAYRAGSASLLVSYDPNTKTWVPFENTSMQIGGFVNTMVVEGNNLYLGGVFTGRVNGNTIAENIAQYTGGSWRGLGDGLQGSIVGVGDIVPAGNQGLVATGTFTGSGATDLEKLAYWDGSQWYPLGPGLFGISGALGFSLFSWNNTFFVGGEFAQAGNVWAENIGAFRLTTETILESDFEGN